MVSYHTIAFQRVSYLSGCTNRSLDCQLTNIIRHAEKPFTEFGVKQGDALSSFLYCSLKGFPCLDKQTAEVFMIELSWGIFEGPK